MGRPSHIFCVLALLALPACGVADLVGDTSAKFDTPAGETMTPEEHAMAIQVFELVNEHRGRAGLPALIWDERAADAAYDHCVDMRRRSYYAHVNPEMLGGCERMRNAGVDMDACAGENLARLNPTAESAMAAWLASPGHRDMIFTPLATHLGVGVHTGAGGPWWAQEFFARAP